MNAGALLSLTAALSGGLPALPRPRAQRARADLGERALAEAKRARRAALRCERIERAALRLSTGEVFSLRRPARHHDVMRSCPSSIDDDHEQGFVTDRGRFVGREEALVLATAARQIVRRCGGDSFQLYSENVW